MMLSLICLSTFFFSLKVGKKNVDVLRKMLAKPIGHEGEKFWSIESQHDTDMVATSAE